MSDMRALGIKIRPPFLSFWIVSCLWFAIANSDDNAPRPDKSLGTVVQLLELVIDADEKTARNCLNVITAAIQNGQLSEDDVDGIRDQFSERLQLVLNDETHALRRAVAHLATSWNDPVATRLSRETFASSTAPIEERQAALAALISAGDEKVLSQVQATLFDPKNASTEFRGSVIDALGRSNQAAIPDVLLSNYPKIEPQLRPRMIEVITQRPEWSIRLLEAINENHIDKDALNLNQLKRVALFKNEQLQKLVTEVYGAIRQDRRSDRQHVINRMRDFLKGTPGDPDQGIAAYKKVCGQCHKMYGEGAEVGPDITRNGRNNWEQLLQNVFDPSAVIGPGYQARTLVTTDGRVLTGLPVEESDQRIVLKIQGGKTETIPRDQIEAYAVSELSMMPEDLEKQLKPQEIADLFAFLALDKPPSDPTGKLLPGAPAPKPR